MRTWWFAAFVAALAVAVSAFGALVLPRMAAPGPGEPPLAATPATLRVVERVVRDDRGCDEDGNRARTTTDVAIRT